MARYRSADETNVALQELDIINSPVRRVSTQTIPSYYRMRIIDRYGLVRSVYQDDAIPDNVWTMIAGEFCSITSSGRRYCSINGRLQGLPSAEKHFENVTICEIIYFIGSLCMTNRDMHLRDDFGIAVSLQSIVGGNGKSCCVKYVTVNNTKIFQILVFFNFQKYYI